MNGEHQDIYKAINQLELKFTEHSTKSQAEHKHLAQTVNTHVAEFKEWKESTEAQLNAIGQGLLQDNARNSTKKEIKGWWYAGVTVVAVVISPLLAVLFQKWFL